jgi:hypothetical protein
MEYSPSVSDCIIANDYLFPSMSTISSSVGNTLVASKPKYDFTASLHIDILVYICKYLPLPSVLKLLLINKKLYSVMDTDIFWEKLTSLYCGSQMRADPGQCKSLFLSLYQSKKGFTPESLELVNSKGNFRYYRLWQ